MSAQSCGLGPSPSHTIALPQAPNAAPAAALPSKSTTATGGGKPALGTRSQQADAAWYAGHVLAAGSLLGHWSLPAGASVASVGQLLTMGSRPWGRSPPVRVRYGDGWQQGADALWYAGHVMCLGTLLSRVCLPAAAALAGAGQAMVMVSRPLGRGSPCPPFAGGARQKCADGLWYLGHVLGTGTVLSPVCFPDAVALSLSGQALVILSRPLGRSGQSAPPPPASEPEHPSENSV